MVRLFPQVVAALISLSALGYFIGWREATGYYNALGAPWAVSMLPPFVLLQLSSTVAVLIGISGFLGFTQVATGSMSVSTLGKVSRIIIWVGMAAIFAKALLLDTLLPAVVTYYAALVVAWAYGAAAGLIIGELLGRLKLSDWGEMKPTHLGSVSMGIVIGLFMVPHYLGQAHAAYDLDCDQIRP
jgi:hypothetical protein